MEAKKNLFRRWAQAFQNRFGMEKEEQRSPLSPRVENPEEDVDVSLDVVDNRLEAPDEPAERDRSGLIRKTDPNEES